MLSIASQGDSTHLVFHGNQETTPQKSPDPHRQELHNNGRTNLVPPNRLHHLRASMPLPPAPPSSLRVVGVAGKVSPEENLAVPAKRHQQVIVGKLQVSNERGVAYKDRSTAIL